MKEARVAKKRDVLRKTTQGKSFPHAAPGEAVWALS
jgi:hypothetical protein